MRFRLIVIHLGFALTGIVTTMLGPILPLLSADWSLNDAQAGRLFTVQFISSVSGSLVASRVLARWGAAVTVFVGMFIIAVGVTCLAIGAHPVSITGIALFGVGLGFALPSTNLLVSELVPDNRASALNLLNFSWTIGALGAPMVIASLVKPIGLRGLMIALAVLCVTIGGVEVAGTSGSAVEERSERVGRLERGWRTWFAFLTTIFLFLYVGVENGFAGWVPSFTARTQQSSTATTALVQSSFWGAILLGRLVAPLVLQRISPTRLIFSGLSLATIGAALTSVSTDLYMLAAGVVACGLGLSAVFPTAIAVFTEWYGSGGAGSIVLGVCGLGGALVPWMVGTISERTGNLRLGLSVTLACIAFSLVIFWRMTSLTKSKAYQS